MLRINYLACVLTSFYSVVFSCLAAEEYQDVPLSPHHSPHHSPRGHRQCIELTPQLVIDALDGQRLPGGATIMKADLAEVHSKLRGPRNANVGVHIQSVELHENNYPNCSYKITYSDGGVKIIRIHH